MKLLRLILANAVLLFSSCLWAGEDGMVNMPKISPKKTYTVDSKERGEDLLDQRGFGRHHLAANDHLRQCGA